jgi:uncharacterized SAM-binding protein YcdF (DUF218 family)
MDFVVSKLGWVLATPANVLLFLLVVGLLRWRRLAWLVAAVFLLNSVLPVGTWMIGVLENRFPQPPLPDRVDGIVVLGGALSLTASEKRGQVTLNDSAERMTQAVVLARRYKDAPLLFSGGEPRIVPEGRTESEFARAFFLEMGLPAEQMRFEDRSRNTWENAVYSVEAVRPKPGETWLLVTSAAHMPGGVGCFRKVGWEILPFPVDYTTATGGGYAFAFAFAENLARFNGAFKEWLGLAAYRAMDRTDALFPAPR